MIEPQKQQEQQQQQQQQQQVQLFAAIVVIAASTLLVLWRCLVWPFIRRHLERKKPFDSLPMPPHSHWLRGHATQGPQQQHQHQKKKVNTIHDLVNRLISKETADAQGRTGIWIWSTPVLVTMNYRDTKLVLRQETRRRRPAVLRLHLNQFLGPRNIGMLEGREWKVHRSAIMRGLAPKVIDAARPMIASIADIMVKSLRDRIHNKNDDAFVVLDVVPLMKMMTIDVFGRVALSTDLDCCRRLAPSPVAQAFDYLSDELSKRMRDPLQPTNFFYGLPTEANRRHRLERDVLFSFIHEKVAERRQCDKQSRPADVLSEILAAFEEDCNRRRRSSSSSINSISSRRGSSRTATSRGKCNGDSTSTFSAASGGGGDEDSEILDSVLATLLFAGYDTTSLTLAYALYLISQHPTVEDLMLREINTSSVRDGGNDISELKYCEAVLWETLRLLPPGILISRSLQKQLTLHDGYVIKAGTMVTMAVLAIHTDETHFGPHPHEFHPERWVVQDHVDGRWSDRIEEKEEGRGNENDDDKGQNHDRIPAAKREAYFPFSYGARNCPGSHLAMQEAVIILTRLIRSLRFTIADPDYELQPVRHGIVHEPFGGLPMRIAIRGESNK